MDITWYGLSCFKIRERGTTIICDPYDRSVGLTLPKLRADLVTCSHDRPGHNATKRVSGAVKVLTEPGEYEIQNVFITGSATLHRRQEDGRAERNIVFFFDLGNFTIGHLGDLGEVPTQSEVDELNLGEVDVLMVPVGGGTTMDPTRAVEVIGILEPKIVIPMHYQQAGLSGAWAQGLEPVDKFLKEFGISAPEPIDVLKLTKRALPEETEVVLLNPAV